MIITSNFPQTLGESV